MNEIQRKQSGPATSASPGQSEHPSSQSRRTELRGMSFEEGERALSPAQTKRPSGGAAVQMLKGPGGLSHRGRIQFQDEDIGVEKSWPWAQETPPTQSDGLSGMDAVWSGLSKSEKKTFDDSYTKCRAYVASHTDLPPGTSLSFYHNDKSKHPHTRCDIEVRKGVAFTKG